MTQHSDSQRSQGKERRTRKESMSSDLNLLIGLSWMGEATADQIGRIWFAGYGASGVRKRLKALKDSGMLTLRYDYERSDQELAPRRTAAGWLLTEVGFALAEERDPAINSDRYLPPRHKVLMDHDLFTSEVVTRIVELARPIGLSGLMVSTARIGLTRATGVPSSTR